MNRQNSSKDIDATRIDTIINNLDNNTLPNLDKEKFLRQLRIICMEQCQNKLDGKEKDICYDRCLSKYDYGCAKCMANFRGHGIPQCMFWGHTAKKYGDIPR